MHGYGRFAVLADLEEEEDHRKESEVDNNDVDEVVSAREEQVALLLEEYDTRPESSLGLAHREMALVRSDKPGSDDFSGDATFEADVVCDGCQAAFPPAEGADGGQLRVDVANASGCRLCEALLNVWARESHNNRYIDLEFWFVARDGYFYGVWDVIFRPTLQLSTIPRMASFGFQSFKNKDADSHGGIPRPPTPSFTVDLPNSTRLEDSQKQIKKWLKHCEGHESCRDISSEADFIPSRLLEITRDDTGKISVRLRCRRDFARAITYATLSHCWGSFVPLKLEESKLTQYRERIPLEEMSPVFRDAIDVSIAMDIWYIWIDSLCTLTEIPPSVTWSDSTRASCRTRKKTGRQNQP
ncbi:hypothetical protein LTR10_007510 [Elasticomyces elasticus]|nr:hypothetical protein LTR10_007510 [Elasticomyces elasticus]KAK4979318.1 hypothetical protein LTR42_001821 [Elasticomyces elasticus]